MGLLILIYPLISRTYYAYQGGEEVDSYQKGLAQLEKAEKQDRLKIAYAYNNALLTNEQTPISDPYSDEEKKEGISHYAQMVEVNEKIGIVAIPELDLKLPIYAGTNETVLQKGVGHMEATSLPVGGLNSHSVLTAHSGLPRNKLFTDLEKMNLDDLFFIETIAGQLAYKVVEIKIIEPSDFEELVIQKNRDLVTLLTCTPYMVNSHRLLVIGERTEVSIELEEDLVEISRWKQIIDLLDDYKWILLVLFLVLVSTQVKLRKRG